MIFRLFAVKVPGYFFLISCSLSFSQKEDAHPSSLFTTEKTASVSPLFPVTTHCVPVATYMIQLELSISVIHMSYVAFVHRSNFYPRDAMLLCHTDSPPLSTAR